MKGGATTAGQSPEKLMQKVLTLSLNPLSLKACFGGHGRVLFLYSPQGLCSQVGGLEFKTILCLNILSARIARRSLYAL